MELRLETGTMLLPQGLSASILCLWDGRQTKATETLVLIPPCMWGWYIVPVPNDPPLWTDGGWIL